MSESHESEGSLLPLIAWRLRCLRAAPARVTPPKPPRKKPAAGKRKRKS